MENEYLDAGSNAQPEIQEAIERFRSMSDDERAKMPLLWWLLGSSTQFFKMTKADANYTSGMSFGCANCNYIYKSVRSDQYICSQIRGAISRSGWCRLWNRSDVQPYSE